MPYAGGGGGGGGHPLSLSHLRVCEGLADGVVNLGRLAATTLPSRNVDEAQPVARPRGLRCVAERLLVELGVTAARGGLWGIYGGSGTLYTIKYSGDTRF